jgi:hypothetical protein
MKIQQQRCDMKTYKIDIAKTKTNTGVGLPYSIVAQVVPVEESNNAKSSSFLNNDAMRKFRKDLVKRYAQKDISCHIDNYTRIATINFRNEEDCADFLMRN